MSTFIHHELLLLVQTIAAGAVLLLCYDLLIAIRNVFVHSDKAAGAEDLLYWICCAFFVFSESCVYLWFWDFCWEHMPVIKQSETFL